MDQLTRIESKLDKVIDKQAEHSATLAVHSTLHAQNTKDLEHHIKRTDFLQAIVTRLENWKWYVAGMAVAASAIATLVVKFL